MAKDWYHSKRATKVYFDENGEFEACRYHSTDVVSVNREAGTITFNHGNWASKTTLSRMVECCDRYELPFRPYVEDGTFFIRRVLNLGNRFVYTGETYEIPSWPTNRITLPLKSPRFGDLSSFVEVPHSLLYDAGIHHKTDPAHIGFVCLTQDDTCLTFNFTKAVTKKLKQLYKLHGDTYTPPTITNPFARLAILNDLTYTSWRAVHNIGCGDKAKIQVNLAVLLDGLCKYDAQFWCI